MPTRIAATPAHCQRAAETLREGRPTNWFAAGVIIAIWIVLAALATALVLRLLDK